MTSIETTSGVLSWIALTEPGLAAYGQGQPMATQVPWQADKGELFGRPGWQHVAGAPPPVTLSSAARSCEKVITTPSVRF